MIRFLVALMLLAVSSCTPAWAGYTLFTYPQVWPEYIVVHDAYGPATAKNPGIAPLFPPGSAVVYKPAGFSIYAADDAMRTVLLADTNGIDLDGSILAALPGLKGWVAEQVKEIRAKALEKATKNSGVYAIYDENYQAAIAYDAGEGDVTVMRNNMTATDYLAGFGARLGMTAGQFAAYIISENHRVGPTNYQVEDEYLRLVYTVIPAEVSVERLLAYPADYRRFCGL